ncbi:MAG TPA: glutaredoxin family protein [Actinomycetes bacterium]|nr:glutaredoxin family protein [Actinomycetes bacterium]
MNALLASAATLASAAFGVSVLAQWRRRRRPYQLAWGLSLAMFAAASLALTVGVAGRWTPLGFKVYYLFGAVLTAPWLALGTVWLLATRRAALATLAALAAFSAAAVALLALAPVTAADVAAEVPEGSRFLPPALRALAVLGNVAGTVVVVGGAVASGLALRQRRELRPRFEGTLLIALGVLLAAGGGAFAFLGRSGGLALALALGAAVMFAGFRRASRPVRPAAAGAPRPPRGQAPARVVTLYTRGGCHLCEDAEAVLERVRAGVAFELRAVDVDADPELARRYGVRVPVVAVDGVERFEYEVPPDLLLQALGAAPRRGAAPGDGEPPARQEHA